MKEVLELEELEGNFWGGHITVTCNKAIELSNKLNKPVHFEFNGTHVTAQPGEDTKTLQSRWEADYEAASKAYREHPDRIKEAEENERKEKAEREAHMIDTSADEKAMREAKVPWPKTEVQLMEYIGSLVNRTHDYGTCVYAMSMAAVATFYYVSGQLGVTGFQSGCADMDILRRTRNMKGPFTLIDGENALYPQYDLVARLEESMEKWKPWLKEQAEIKLLDSTSASPSVIDHWKKLAAMDCKKEQE